MGQLQNQFQQMMGQSPYSGGGGQQQPRISPVSSMGFQQGMGRGYAGGQQRGNFGDPRYQQPQTRGSGGYSGQPQTLSAPWPAAGAGPNTYGQPQPRPQQPWSEFEPQKPQQAPIQRGIDQMPGRGGMTPDQQRAYGDNMMMQIYNAEQERMKDPAYAAQRAASQKAWDERPVQQGRTGAVINGQPGQPPPSTQTGGFKPEKGQPQLSGPPMMPPTKQPPTTVPPGTGGIKPQREPVGPPVPSTTPPNPAQQRIDPSRVQASASGTMQGGSVSQPVGQMQPGALGSRRGYRNPYKQQQGYGGGPRPDGGPEFMY